jgi:toxin ParE1/3/4
MTSFYNLSPLAQLDLDQISNYTADNWGREQAKNYSREFTRCFELLAKKPIKGRSCPEVRQGYYKYKSGSHFIFYRLNDSGIDIFRILHERMDFRQYLN